MSRGRALSFSRTFGTRCGWRSDPRSGRLYPREKTRYSFYSRLGGPHERSGRAENLVPIGTFFYLFYSCMSLSQQYILAATHNGSKNDYGQCCRWEKLFVPEFSHSYGGQQQHPAGSSGSEKHTVRTTNSHSMALDSMSLGPNSLKAPIFHISLLYREA